MPMQHWISSVAMAAVLALTCSTAVQAQPRPHGSPPSHHAGGHDQGPPPGWHAPQVRPPHPGYRPPPPPPPPPPRYYRGAGPKHNWVKGHRLPPQYRAPKYVVKDWRKHRLHQPPRGYHWVRYGNDYMLVAIASGVITQLILHHMH